MFQNVCVVQLHSIKLINAARGMFANIMSLTHVTYLTQILKALFAQQHNGKQNVKSLIILKGSIS